MLQELKREQRQFVADYYHGTGRQMIERRRDMAKRLGLTLGDRATWACRR